MKEVYAFIEEKKREGDPAFIEAFPIQDIQDGEVDDYPTFDIKNSKHGSYGYLHDSKWNVVEEEVDFDIEGDFRKDPNFNEFNGEFVHSAGKIKAPKGVKPHTKPSANNREGDSDTIPFGSDVKIIAKSADHSKGFYYVETKDGTRTWVPESAVLDTGEYDPDGKLIIVEDDANLTKIVHEEPMYDQLNKEFRIGFDERHVVVEIYRQNKETNAVYLDPEKYLKSMEENASKDLFWDTDFKDLRREYQSVEIRKDHILYLPSPKVIKENADTRPEWKNDTIKFGRQFQGLLEGLWEGLKEGATEFVEGLWDLIKKIFTGEIFGDLVDLFKAIMNMDLSDLGKFLMAMIGIDPDELKYYWNHRNPRKQMEYFGKIIGKVLFEILLAIAGGTLTKMLGKIPALKKFTKLSSRVKGKTKDKLKELVGKGKKTKESSVIPPVVTKTKPNPKYLAKRPKIREYLTQKNIGSHRPKNMSVGDTKRKFDDYLSRKDPDVLDDLNANPKKLDAEYDEFVRLENKKTNKPDAPNVKKPSYKIGESDGGPGTWQKRTFTGKAKDADFQQKVTGAPKDVEYPVKGPNPKGEVKFDGYDPDRNVLIDAKRFEDFPKIHKGKIIGKENILAEAKRQIAAYRKGAKIEWHVAGQEQAKLLNSLLRKNGLDQIKVIYPPKTL